MSKLAKIPTLGIADDAKVAAKLREMIADANDGFRRVVKVGLLIEWIAANLNHGDLLPWIEAHVDGVSLRTIYNWRSLAKNLCEWSGLEFKMLKGCEVPGDKLLDCPIDKLPAKLKPCREKMEAALTESKSAKQLFLFLGFKQGEIDAHGYPIKKRGRLKGSDGNPKHKRLAHAQKLREADLAGRKLFLTNLGAAADEAADEDILAAPELAAEFDACFEQIENLFRTMQRVKQAR